MHNRATSPYRAPSPYGQAYPPRAYSPQPPSQRAYSPQPPSQRAYSPQPPTQPPPQPPQPHGPVPPAGTQVAPGSVTYTTSNGPDGRIIYHPFRAVAASYQTPTGIVSGIQWVPAEATHVLPQGAQPASSDFAGSWNRDYTKDDKLKEWQREEDKRRKREEKESKRLREQQEYRADEKAREYERERRKSFNAGPPLSNLVSFPPTTPSTGHPVTPYNQSYVEAATSPYGVSAGGGANVYSRERKYSNAGGYDALNRQFDDMDLNRGKERERKFSGSGRPPKYGTSGSDERPGHYTSPYPPQATSSPYGSPYVPPVAPGYGTLGGKYSPNPAHPTELPFVQPGTGNPTYPGAAYSSSTRGDVDPRTTASYGTTAHGVHQQVYPRGHVMEGQPVPPRSRTSSPMPGPPPGASPYNPPYVGQPGSVRSHSPHPPPSPRMGGASPHVHGGMLPDAGQQLPPPEAFSRPMNQNLTFSPFDTLKVQTMEDFLLSPQLPRMPPVLKAHDVLHTDWQRLMSDLRLAWNGRLPVPTDTRSGQPPRRTTLVADLVDLWNSSFFLPRGVEIVLYKGHERRSGPRAGAIDHNLPDDRTSDRSESEEDDYDEDESELEEYLSRNANAYGRPQDFDPVIIARRRREAREEKRRARREKEAKRKARAKEREKVYALYISYVSVSGAVHTAGGIPGGYPPVSGTGYGTATSSHGGRHGGY